MNKINSFLLGTIISLTLVPGCTSQQSNILPDQGQAQNVSEPMKIFDKIAVDKDELITFEEFKLLGIFAAGNSTSTNIDQVEENLEPMQKNTFDSLDLNRDGRLTRPEFLPLEKKLDALTATDIFNKIAVDKDGLITPDEYRLLGVFGITESLREEDQISGLLNKAFAALDKNKDNKLNREEFNGLKL
jgi:Ca2+-binding EF-hand superfamily protein